MDDGRSKQGCLIVVTEFDGVQWWQQGDKMVFNSGCGMWQ
jgi:hypothetical protein